MQMRRLRIKETWIFLAMAIGCVGCTTPGGVKALDELPHAKTSAEFDRLVTNAKGVVLVDFYSPACPPCRKLAPIIRDLAKEYQGKAAFVAVNVLEAGEIGQRFSIRSIPTLILYRDGAIMDRWQGFREANYIRVSLDRVLAAAQPPQPK